MIIVGHNRHQQQQHKGIHTGALPLACPLQLQHSEVPIVSNIIMVSVVVVIVRKTWALSVVGLVTVADNVAVAAMHVFIIVDAID